VSSFDYAQPIRDEGDEEDRDLIVTLSPPTRASGTVLGEKSEPVPNARVALLERSSGVLRELTTDGAGKFSLELPSEGLWLYVEANGFRPSVLSDMYAAGEGMEIRLERPRRLRIETRMGGQPIEAAVEVKGLEHPHHVTATGGTAVLEDLGSGSVDVTASYKEFVSPKTPIELNELETTMRLDLKPAARLMVEVLDEGGEPVSAHVTVEGYGASESKDSDENGGLIIFDRLAEGSYQVAVESPGLRDSQRRVDLHAGDNKLDVVLQKASAISGRVVDGDGKPVENATVELVSQIHEGRATTCDDQGEFTLQVDEPGAYRLRARSPAHGVVVTQTNAPAEGVVLKLEPLGRLDVHVTADRVPLRGAYVSVLGVARVADDSATAVTDEKGVAHLAGLHGGEYTVNVEQQGYQRLEPKPVKLAVTGRLEVTIALEKGVEISGTVIDENSRPVANVGVRTMDDEAADAGTFLGGDTAFSDDEGHFTLDGLKPGRGYQLTAVSDDRTLPAPVRVKAPQTGVTLRLQPMPSISGRVVDEAGQALTKFRVDGREIEAADGRFSVPREKESDGKLVMSVEADGYQLQTIERDYTTDVGDVALKKAPMVNGVVVDSTGQPVSGVDVNCDQCVDAAVTGADGRFSLAVSAEPPEATITASKLNLRGHAKGTAGQPITVTLQEPVRVDGIVKDPQGRALQARVVIREVNGGDEQRVDSGPDGKFAIDLPEGLWMFITRASASGQTVKVVAPRMFVTLGAPPGTCAVTITVAESVGDAWLVPGEPTGIPLDNLDDDTLYAGAVALDLPLPNKPTRSAGLQCGVYTLVTTDSSGVRRERVDVRASEATFALGPAPAPTPAPAVQAEQAEQGAADHPGEP
jgi:protocatechuate 3,4-dioxygenase beta subunit